MLNDIPHYEQFIAFNVHQNAHTGNMEFHMNL
jgi:hypothetical protein